MKRLCNTAKDGVTRYFRFDPNYVDLMEYAPTEFDKLKELEIDTCNEWAMKAYKKAAEMAVAKKQDDFD